jgi:signal transduction histidine kinase
MVSARSSVDPPRQATAALPEVPSGAAARRRQLDRLVERERLAAIGVTAAKLAHEIGNPLNGMLLNLQLLARRIAARQPHDRLAGLVERVEGEVLRMAKLLEEFRGMSRRQSFLLEPVFPLALLEHLEADHRAEYEAEGVCLELCCQPGLPALHVDRCKMLQVLLNLGKNAVEAMRPSGGTLTLGAHAEQGGVLVTVADTGPGVADGIDVFEPFATTKPDGTGLGVPVARQIVAGHGGELRYESVPGQGTTFMVWLPVVAVAREPAARATPFSAASDASTSDSR